MILRELSRHGQSYRGEALLLLSWRFNYQGMQPLRGQALVNLVADWWKKTSQRVKLPS
jgi:hypothetical protein